MSSKKGNEEQRSQQPTPATTPRSQAGSEAKTPRSERSQRSQRSQPVSQSNSPRRNSRVNKLYRTPPTPPPEEMMAKEKSFVLDCNAVSSVSIDYSKANPKLGPVIPPYNSQHDRHVTQYFTFLGVNRTLKRTGQTNEERPLGTSIEGPYADRFHNEGKGYMYLSKRNQHGAGHSRDNVDGHAQFMQGIKPVIGYNGKFGYRRNNPWLRAEPSPFGTATTSPLH